MATTAPGAQTPSPAGSGRRRPAGATGAAAARARPYRRSPLDRPLASYYLVLGASLMLLAMGLVMVLSSSSVIAYRSQGSSYAIFQRQLLWCAVGVPLMLLASRLPLQAIRWFAWPAMLGSLVLVALVQVPGLGVEVNGNVNWLALGPTQIQPSEVAKLALVLWGADLLARKQAVLELWTHLLVPLVPAAVLVVGLVVMGDDLGTALVLLVIPAALLFFAGAPLRLFAAVSGVGLAAATYLALTASHRLSRIKSLFGECDGLDICWQVNNSKYALGSGGWFGVGLGASREKWGWLPEQHTDFIFSIIGEELGLVGTLLIVALLATLVYAALRIARRTDQCFVRLAAGAVAAWFAVQSVINIGMVLGVLPVIGIPLPLLSYGGSALIPTLLAIGLLLAFARQERGAAAALSARPRLRDRLSPGGARRTSGRRP